MTPFAAVTNLPSESINRQPTSVSTISTAGITQFHYDDHWEELEIDLHRVNNILLIFILFSKNSIQLVTD